MTISPISPVYFPDFGSPFPSKSWEDMQCCQAVYYQCWEPTDTIRFQLNSEGVLLLGLKANINGVPFDPVSVITPPDGSGPYYDFDIPLTQFDGQEISLKLIQDNGVVPPSILSCASKMFVGDCGCSILIDYWADCDSFGTYYESGIQHQIRLKTRYFDLGNQNVISNSYSKNSSGVWEFCNTDQDEIYDILTPRLPQYMHRMLRKVFEHPNLLIDGAQFVPHTGFVYRGEKKCGMRGGFVQVKLKQSNCYAQNCC